jgi:hypothetical protein
MSVGTNSPQDFNQQYQQMLFGGQSDLYTPDFRGTPDDAGESAPQPGSGLMGNPYNLYQNVDFRSEQQPDTGDAAPQPGGSNLYNYSTLSPEQQQQMFSQQMLFGGGLGSEYTPDFNQIANASPGSRGGGRNWALGEADNTLPSAPATGTAVNMYTGAGNQPNDVTGVQGVPTALPVQPPADNPVQATAPTVTGVTPGTTTTPATEQTLHDLLEQMKQIKLQSQKPDQMTGQSTGVNTGKTGGGTGTITLTPEQQQQIMQSTNLGGTPGLSI